ncbi:28613_t:CDS:2 [Gigaspora margarita]|uniref:28613_t:CDS:1 n=1 Tax=Gigaspora margarita TaxID=4874 RepID=A0ABN7V6F6_GIGMA|nr:28613_t:CDS:2 [Gigaspora margarita]
MFTSSWAETLPREYDKGYASSIYLKDTIRPTKSIPIYYKIQLEKEKEDND